MNKKRLDRDKWGFLCFPYYQMRIDTEDFHGLAAVISLTDGDYYYWDLPIAGKVPVCGGGMLWLELIPDNQERVITVKYLKPENGERRASVWYVDVIEKIVCDEDGTLAFIDKYLDVIFTPQGDVKVDDRDELDNAYETGDITKAQYDAALAEGDRIVSELCTDIKATEEKCARLLKHALMLIEEGKTTLARNVPMKVVFLDIDGVLNTFNPASYYQEIKHSAVKALKAIVDATNAKIVVISTWKLGSNIYAQKYGAEEQHNNECDNWKNLTDILNKYGLEVFDITPSGSELPTRSSEIKAYLAARRDVEAFVILDDCFQDDYSDDEVLKKRLVFVNCGPSLNESDVPKAINMLNMEYKAMI